jgi:hypothetical protein
VSEHIMSFRCVSCGEYINTSMAQCRYCAAPIDAEVARKFSLEQDKVNKACSEASYIKSVAVVLAVSCGLSFLPIPIFNNMALLFFCATYLAVPTMVLRWQYKFGQLRSSDPDYSKAKRVRNVALLLWGVASIPFVMFFLLIGAMYLKRQAL